MNQKYGRLIQRLRWFLITAAVILGVIAFMWLFMRIVIGPGNDMRSSMESAFTPPKATENEGGGTPEHTKIVVPYNGLQELPDGTHGTIGSVTAIFVEFENADDYNNGSGFVIGRDLVATTAHIIPEKEYKALVVACNNTRSAGRVAYLDRNRDVAFIRAECGETQAELDNEALAVDDPLIVSGYMFYIQGGRTYRHTVAEQFVSNTSLIPSAKITREIIDSASNELTRSVLAATLTGDIPPMSAISGAVVPGNSGSPVFRQNGRVAGMASVFDLKMNRTYMIRAESLKQALEAYEASISTNGAALKE